MAKNEPLSRKPTPLGQVFGRVLRLLRSEQQLSVGEFASLIDLNAHTIRRVEAGTEILHPKYAPRVARALVDTGLDWGRLAQVLAILHAVREQPTDHTSIRSAAADFSMYDEGLGKAIAEVPTESTLFGAEESKSAIARAIQQMKAYLQTHGAGSATSPRLPQGIAEVVSQVSPLFFDLVADQLRRLAAFPPQVTMNGLIQWESSNASRFRRVFAVTRQHALLVAAAKAAVFDWTYVWRENCEGIFILILEGQGIAAEVQATIHDALVRRVQQRHGASGDKLYRAILRDKVRVKSVNTLAAQLRDRLSAVVPGARGVIGNSPENAWFFQMEQPGYVVAYTDNATQLAQADIEARVLEWDSALDLTAELDIAWRDELAGALTRRERV